MTKLSLASQILLAGLLNSANCLALLSVPEPGWRWPRNATAAMSEASPMLAITMDAWSILTVSLLAEKKPGNSLMLAGRSLLNWALAIKASIRVPVGPPL